MSGGEASESLSQLIANGAFAPRAAWVPAIRPATAQALIGDQTLDCRATAIANLSTCASGYDLRIYLPQMLPPLLAHNKDHMSSVRLMIGDRDTIQIGVLVVSDEC